MISTKYVIQTNLIDGLPQIPFRQGVGKYEGVVMHATAVYSDTATGERQYETQHFDDAFVHTFTDKTQILKVADFNYISYNAGHTANQRYLGNELCQSHDHDEFLIAYDKWVWLAAHQLYAQKLGVIDGETLLSHHQCTLKWHESTHTDPDSYLAEHGVVWANVVAAVTAYYNQFEEEEKLMDELKAQVEALSKKVADLEAANVDQAVPDWFVQEFGQDALNGIVDTPQGPYVFWRLVTVAFRLAKHLHLELK